MQTQNSAQQSPIQATIEVQEPHQQKIKDNNDKKTLEILSPLKKQFMEENHNNIKEYETPKIQKSIPIEKSTVKKAVNSYKHKDQLHVPINENKNSHSKFLSPRAKTSRDLGWVNQKQQTPGPGQYKTVTCFEKARKAFDFSKAPDRNPVKAYVSPEHWKNPAPGQYQIEKSTQKKSPAFTMSAKYKDMSKVQTQQSQIGPGQYQNSQIFSPNGKYTLSTHKNTHGALISPRDTPKYIQFKNKNPGVGQYQIQNQHQNDKKGFSMSAKFKDFLKQQPQKTPGPGNYNNSQILSAQGKYTLSTHINIKGASISPSQVPKYVQFKNINPGPGQYKTDNMKEKKSAAYTMSAKYKNFQKVQPQLTPGPGNYENSQILSPEGQYKLSTHKNTLGAIISPKQTPKYVEFKNNNPAPGQYNTQNLKQNKSPSFSMSIKYQDPSKQVIEQTPGPGNYSDSQIFSPEGKYVLSNHKNTKSALISHKQTPKYVQFKNTYPGPGQYLSPQKQMSMSFKGYTTMQNFAKKEFKPNMETDLTVPGPGWYQAPSDFNKFDILAKKLKLKKKEQNK